MVFIWNYYKLSLNCALISNEQTGVSNRTGDSLKIYTNLNIDETFAA